MLACLILLLALLPAAAAPAAPAALAAPAPAALLMHSPHDVIEAWAISPAFATDRTLWVSLPRFNLLLRSRDGGEHFETVSAGLATSLVTWITVSPDYANDRTLWCSEMRGLFVSHDGGDSWMPMQTPAGMRNAPVIAVSPNYAQDGTLAAGTRRDGLWITRDRGANWAQAPLPGWKSDVRGSVGPIAFSPGFATDGGLVAVVGGGSLARSSDGGRSFAALVAPPGGVQALALGETFGAHGTLWVGTRGSGVWRSDNGGDSFQRDGSEVAAMNVLQLSRATGPEGGVLFASTAVNGVQVKPDGGTWTSNPAGFREQTHQTELHYVGTMPSPAFATDHTVFAATFEGLYVSRSGGLGWEWLNVLHPQLVRNLAMSTRFAEDQTMWLSTYGAGLLQTRDAGQTFSMLATDDWMFPDGIAASPDWSHDGTLLIGTPNRLLMTTDGGKSCKAVLPDGRGFPRIVAFAPDWAQSGIAFAHFTAEASSRNRFVRTTDRGATWIDVNIKTVLGLAFAPDWPTSRRVWAACPEGLRVSQDGGATFAAVDALDAGGIGCVSVAPGHAPGPPPAEGEPAPGEIVMVGSPATGIHLSRDGGRSWKLLPLGDPSVRASSLRMSPGFARDGIAFAGPISDVLRVTRDGGLSWKPVAPGPRVTVTLELSPAFETDHTLVVGSYEGPWISRDAGESWTRIVTPVPAEAAMSREPPPAGSRATAPKDKAR